MRWCLLFLLLGASSVRGQTAFLTPNGDPSGPSSVQSPGFFNYTVGLWYTGQAMIRFNPPNVDNDLLRALSIAGIVSKDWGGDWTINATAFPGNLILDKYTAWCETRPGVTKDAYQRSFDIADSYAGSGGGCEIVLDFHPTQPMLLKTHWINWYNSNAPQANYPVFLSPEGPFLDNQGSPPGNPFYDAIPGVYATSQDFLDAPSRPYNRGTYMTFHTRLATCNSWTKTLTISYYEVIWGFVIQ